MHKNVSKRYIFHRKTVPNWGINITWYATKNKRCHKKSNVKNTQKNPFFFRERQKKLEYKKKRMKKKKNTKNGKKNQQKRNDKKNTSHKKKSQLKKKRHKSYSKTH